MDLADLLAALARRRWFVLLGVVLTAALSAGVVALVGPEYIVRSSLLLLPPPTTVSTATAERTPSNPYLALGGLQPAADVLSRALSDGAVHESLAPNDGTAEFTAARDTSSSGPLLLIEAKDVTAQGALETVAAVVQRAPEVLRDLQTEVGAPSDTLLRLSEVARDLEAEQNYKDLVRAILVVVAAGLGGTLFGVMLLDSYLLRRHRRIVDKAKAEHTAPSAASVEFALVGAPESAIPHTTRLGHPKPSSSESDQKTPSGQRELATPRSSRSQ